MLDRLQQSLPAGYEIFHSVAWQGTHRGEHQQGEIDLVVLAPNGNMLLMEVKSGDVELVEGNLFKLYGKRRHDVARQTLVQHAAMLARLVIQGILSGFLACQCVESVVGFAHVDRAAIDMYPNLAFGEEH
ncbi:MAG: NERD domain-containing protein [Sterolibacterium sp.]|nr:NERD domain-containing protein [Sterolibacterium sp.]